MTREKAKEILRVYLNAMVEEGHIEEDEKEDIKFNSFLFDECSEEVSDALHYFIFNDNAGWEDSYISQYIKQ